MTHGDAQTDLSFHVNAHRIGRFKELQARYPPRSPWHGFSALPAFLIRRRSSPRNPISVDPSELAVTTTTEASVN